jgi:hypothetical protein
MRLERGVRECLECLRGCVEHNRERERSPALPYIAGRQGLEEV